MNIALIGLGMVSTTHVAAINNSDKNLKLYGVLSRNSEKTAQFAAENVTYAYNSLEKITQDEDIGFVIVATPPDARLGFVETLAAAGKPILMEKPIERNLKAATYIVEICEKASVPLGLVLQHRAREASLALKSVIDAGQLGEICTVDLRVPWWREQSYYDAPGRGTYVRDSGGVMITQAIHTLDLVIWLLGPIISVQAMMKRTLLHLLEAEDWAGALFEMHSGALGSLLATTSSYPGSAETITIQGSKGSAHLQSGKLNLMYMDGRRETFGALSSTGGGSNPMVFTHEWHQFIIEDFGRAITNGIPPLATARSALRSHAVIDAMKTASQSAMLTKVSL